MANFGITCPPITGHLEPLFALGRTLIQRGHNVTAFHVADVRERALAGAIGFESIAADDFPLGSVPQATRLLAAKSGFEALRFAMECELHLAEAVLRDLPSVIQNAEIDLLIVDQNEPAGGSVAQMLNIPFVNVCTSLPLNRGAQIPPPFFPWQFTTGRLARWRNQSGYMVADLFTSPLTQLLNEFRRKWNLIPIKTPDDSFSSVAQIAQMAKEFDFPNECLPPSFHYCGPLVDDHRQQIDFPYDKLDGRPLIYASLGTLQANDHHLFRIISSACRNLPAQLVMSLGSSPVGAKYTFPDDQVVINYAPQLEILRRAALVITHGGMNTTQQALAFGVPLIALPLTHDQPAIAARLERTGAGLVLNSRKATADGVRSAIEAILTPSSSWRHNALRMSRTIKAAGGVDRAATIIESVLAGTLGPESSNHSRVLSKME